MDRRTAHLVAVAVGMIAAAIAFQFLGTTVALALAVGLALGAFVRLSIAHPDLLVYGHQPKPVSRWGAAAAGFTVGVSLLVYSAGVPALGGGERVALGLLVLAGVWAGVGFGIGMARADASDSAE